MHPRRVFRLIGLLVFFVGLTMALALLVSVVYKEPSTWDLGASMVITCGSGLILFLVTKGEEVSHLSHRDGVAIVTFGWFIAGAVGALPFLVSGSIDNFTDAYFESVSGFTTTGASILSDIEKLPKGILMWRSIISWLGGMGIIVLSIAILPFLGIGGMQLYKAEVPSPVVDKLKPRISDTAKVLWKVYILLTAVQVLLLLGGGMPLFDSVCHAFCTMPTCGFSPKNKSIGYYDSPYVDGVIIVFMLLASFNFSLHYRLLKGETGSFGKDPECRVFLIIVGILILLVTLDIYGSVYPSLTQAFRYAAFQVSSLISTTGFVTADYRHLAVLVQVPSGSLHVFWGNGGINRRRDQNCATDRDGQARLPRGVQDHSPPRGEGGQTGRETGSWRHPERHLGVLLPLSDHPHDLNSDSCRFGPGPDFGVLRSVSLYLQCGPGPCFGRAHSELPRRALPGQMGAHRRHDPWAPRDLHRDCFVYAGVLAQVKNQKERDKGTKEQRHKAAKRRTGYPTLSSGLLSPCSVRL